MVVFILLHLFFADFKIRLDALHNCITVMRIWGETCSIVIKKNNITMQKS